MLLKNIKTGNCILSLKVFTGYIHNGKKQIPKNLVFRCGMTHLAHSLMKLGKTFKLEKNLLKTEMNHDEIYTDFWMDRKD